MPAPNKKGGAPPALPAILEALSERQQKLDAADTRLSEVIKRAEAALQLRLSVRVSVEITNESDLGDKTVLAFGRHEGEWQFLIETERDRAYPDVRPLLSSSREMRARVV